jgi:hypothetical protein
MRATDYADGFLLTKNEGSYKANPDTTYRLGNFSVFFAIEKYASTLKVPFVKMATEMKTKLNIDSVRELEDRFKKQMDGALKTRIKELISLKAYGDIEFKPEDEEQILTQYSFKNCGYNETDTIEEKEKKAFAHFQKLTSIEKAEIIKRHKQDLMEEYRQRAIKDINESSLPIITAKAHLDEDEIRSLRKFDIQYERWGTINFNSFNGWIKKMLHPNFLDSRIENEKLNIRREQGWSQMKFLQFVSTVVIIIMTGAVAFAIIKGSGGSIPGAGAGGVVSSVAKDVVGTSIS